MGGVGYIKAWCGSRLVEGCQGGDIEERFLHCVSRLLRRSEGEERASAYFGRNDRVVACAESYSWSLMGLTSQGEVGAAAAS